MFAARQAATGLVAIASLVVACTSQKSTLHTRATATTPSSTERSSSVPSSVASVVTEPQPSDASPCGRTSVVPATYEHVIWIVLENENATDVLGNRVMPFTNGLAAACGTARNYRAIRHPSLPNYIAMTSGDTQGVTDDSGPDRHPLGAPSIYSQVRDSGREWRQFASRMPSNCGLRDDPPAPNAYYTVHHVPVAYYTSIRGDCGRWSVPLGSTSSGALASALDSSTLPAFAFISPADDGGNQSRGGEVDPELGDPFLRSWVGRITSSPSYRSGSTAIFVTWDEGNFSVQPRDPQYLNVLTIVIAPSVARGSTSNMPANHYSLLRTTEELLRLPLLGQASAASSLREPFHL
jgi:hypothetical protein